MPTFGLAHVITHVPFSIGHFGQTLFHLDNSDLPAIVIGPLQARKFLWLSRSPSNICTSPIGQLACGPGARVGGCPPLWCVFGSRRKRGPGRDLPQDLPTDPIGAEGSPPELAPRGRKVLHENKTQKTNENTHYKKTKQRDIKELWLS